MNDIYKAHIEWLQTVKAGDDVTTVYQQKPARSQAKVLRVTKTMIVLTNGKRFYRANGRIVGQDVGSYGLRKPAEASAA